ncbi:hypothetical protein [Anaerovorax odorimutans]|uniref:hypothetical protein n=1 Tax=Anaerovorax odorimutans TaxID=109327 RepID=UPI00040AFC8D|nr:hypothetical protein [Anaerovorax odorimutans]
MKDETNTMRELAVYYINMEANCMNVNKDTAEIQKMKLKSFLKAYMMISLISQKEVDNFLSEFDNRLKNI